jgi:hypothetical protein
MSRILIIVGLLIALVGVGWPWLSKIPLGRLPGDIRVERPGFSFYFPLTTSVIISVVVSLVMYFFRRK